MVNTFDIPVNADCGVSGRYTASPPISALKGQSQLGPPTSLLGAFSQANFAGGISADDGASFGNVFSPWDSLDITAVITVDPVHVGEPGFLMVAALLPDQLLMLNEQDQFVDVSAAGSRWRSFGAKCWQKPSRLKLWMTWCRGYWASFS